MKKYLLIFLFIPYSSFSQELNLNFFEKLNGLTISSVNEILVDGYGFLIVSENKYLHPKSTGERNALMITIKEFEFQIKTRKGRDMEIICSNNLDINIFKSELLEQGYEFQGNSKDPSVNVKYYEKGADKDVAIFTLKNGDIKKYQINFITRY